MRNASIASRAAYAAANLFALHLVTYLIPSLRDATLATSATVALVIGILALAQHVVVFPVVAALPAPTWAKGAGYCWLVVDMLTEVLQLGGASKSLYLVLRLIFNVAAALWIACASWQAPKKAIRRTGVFVAADFALYSLLSLLTGFAPWVFVVALPSLVLLPDWFLLVGKHLSHVRKAAPVAG
jgi:hypothetical protein